MQQQPQQKVNTKWYVILKQKAYEVQTPQYMHDSLTNMLYFLSELRLFKKKGFLHVVPGAFVYEGSKIYNDALILKPLPESWEIPTSDATINLKNNTNIDQKLEHYLKSVAQWKLLETKIELYGPVSCTAMNIPEKNIVFFGDIHDNLAVKSQFSNEQVQSIFAKFFTSRVDSDQDMANFTHIIQKMKQSFFLAQESSKQIFVWEFILQLLVANANECIDVIVEDSLQSSLDFAKPTSYLQAVRHLFSICPMIEFDDSPFRNRVVECQQLYSNVRYHRIDLRFSIHENCLGQFENDDVQSVLGTILHVLVMFVQMAKEDKDVLFQTIFVPLVEQNHNMDNANDMKVLFSECLRMSQAFAKSSHVEKLEHFVKSFTYSALFYAKKLEHKSTKKSKWFKFRTCVTDIYGLSRLFRQKMTPLSERYTSQQPGEICSSADTASHKAIVYVGEYHAKLWKLFCSKMFNKASIVVYIDEKNKQTRTLKFDAFQRKPLMDVSWQNPKLKFDEWMEHQSKESVALQFLSLISVASISKFYVPHLTSKTRDKQKLEFFASVPHQVNTLMAKQMATSRMCPTSTDVMQLEFDHMSFDELDAVYVKNNNCYSAHAMFAWWQQNYKEHKTFRDPLTRKVVSGSDQDNIMTLINKNMPSTEEFLLKPVRPLNPYQMELVFSTTTFSVQDNNIRFRTAHARVVMNTKNADRIVPFDATQHDAKDNSNTSSHVFLLSLVHCPNKETWKKIQSALTDFMTFAKDIIFDVKKSVIRHKAIHFSNFQNEAKWMVHNTIQIDSTRLEQFKNELLPYISFDW